MKPIFSIISYFFQLIQMWIFRQKNNRTKIIAYSLFMLVPALLVSCTPFAPMVYHTDQCAACHHPYLESIGPSLGSIADSYEGDSEKLMQFFNGRGGPLVEANRFPIMAPMMRPISKWSNVNKQEMAEYIVGFRD